jgi:anti-sigma B factor antagonist
MAAGNGCVVTTEVVDDQVVVEVIGSVDTAAAPVVGDRLSEAVLHPALTGVVVDLTGVDFLNSVGLSVLVRARRTAAVRGLDMRVVCSGPVTRRPIEAAGLDQVLQVVSGLDEAIGLPGDPVGDDCPVRT